MKIDVQQISRFAALSISASLLLIGCGGGGNTTTTDTNASANTSTPTTNTTNTTECRDVALSLKGVDWAAYQSGLESWTVVSQSELANGTIAITPDENCKFSTVYVCAGEPTVNVGHYTSDQVNEISYTCEEETFYQVSGTVNGLNEGNGAMVTVGGSTQYVAPTLLSAQMKISETGLSYTVNYVSKGTHDLAAIETDASQIPVKFGIRRGISVEGNKTGEDVTVEHDVTPYNIAIAGATSTFAGLVTKNNTRIYGLQKYGDIQWYKPSSDALIDGDLYEFNGYWSDSEHNSVQVGEYVAPESAGDYSYDLSGIPLLNVTAVNTFPMQFENLNYEHDSLVYYAANFSKTGGATWNILISKSWLGDQTTYAQADFSTLENWNNEWSNFQDGDTISWGVGAYISSTQDANNQLMSKAIFSSYSDIFAGMLWMYIYIYFSFVLGSL